jgi:hypothetical protein
MKPLLPAATLAIAGQAIAGEDSTHRWGAAARAKSGTGTSAAPAERSPSGQNRPASSNSN